MSEEIKKYKVDFEAVANLIAREEDGRFHPKSAHKYSPTELCGCIRNSFFSRKFPVEYDDFSYRNFFLGNVFHEIFQSKMNDLEFRKKIKDKLGIDIEHVENEKAFHYLLPSEKTNGRRVIISGRLDTVIYLRGEEKPYVVDYKTVSDGKYQLKEGKSKIEHQRQVNFYLGVTLGDEGGVIYIDKRRFWIIQYEFSFDGKMFDEMIAFAVQLDDCLEKDVVPSVSTAEQYKAGNCQYCKHSSRCSKIQ